MSSDEQAKSGDTSKSIEESAKANPGQENTPKKRKTLPPGSSETPSWELNLTNEPEKEPIDTSSNNFENNQISKAPTNEQEDGGEWEILSGNVLNWIKKKDLSSQWALIRQGLILFIAVTTSILIIGIYGRILEVISIFPLAPKLFELAGTIWVALFTSTKLLRSEERKELLLKINERWESFRGSE